MYPMSRQIIVNSINHFSREHLNFKIKTHFFDPQNRPKQFLHMYLHVNFSDIIYSIEKSPSTRVIFHKLEYF